MPESKKPGDTLNWGQTHNKVNLHRGLEKQSDHLFTSETSKIKQSVQSALLIMRGMHAQLMILDRAEAEREDFTSKIEDLQRRFDNFTSILQEVDIKTIPRTINPETVSNKLHEIADTMEILKELRTEPRDQNIFAKDNNNKYAIFSNMLNEAIKLGIKYLDILDKKATKKSGFKP